MNKLYPLPKKELIESSFKFFICEWRFAKWEEIVKRYWPTKYESQYIQMKINLMLIWTNKISVWCQEIGFVVDTRNNLIKIYIFFRMNALSNLFSLDLKANKNKVPLDERKNEYIKIPFGRQTYQMWYHVCMKLIVNINGKLIRLEDNSGLFWVSMNVSVNIAIHLGKVQIRC